MTDNDRLAILWLHASDISFNAGLALVIVLVIMRMPLPFLFFAVPLFAMSCWYSRKAIKAQLEAGRGERTVDQY